VSGGAIKKLRRQKIKQQLKEQKATKEAKEFTDKMREEVANMTDQELDELSKEIASIIEEEKEEE
jgi:hypothetical protein